MSTGPFLYDDEPAPLHTGRPRRRHGLLIALFGGTALFAVVMVGLSFLIKGSPDDQAREVAGVFLTALAQGDTETAHGLLCEDERAELEPGEVADRYMSGAGEITTVVESEGVGDGVREVGVRWAEGSESRLVVISEDGPRVCGLG